MSTPRQRLIVTSGNGHQMVTRRATQATARAEIVIADQPGQRAVFAYHPGVALSVEGDGSWSVAVTGPKGVRETVASGTLPARPYAWRWVNHRVAQWGQCEYSGVITGDPAVWAQGHVTARCPNRCPGSRVVAATADDVKAAPGRTVDLNQVADLLTERGITAAVEFVGGGAYTILVGHVVGYDAETEFHELAVGTGWAEPDGRIYAANNLLVAGPHDETLTEAEIERYTRQFHRVDDEQSIATVIAELLEQVRADRVAAR